MTITSTVAIDLVDRDRYPLAQVYAKQDDSLSRAIAASIYAAGVAWVPPSGATAVIRYRRPDGIGGIYDELPDGSVAYTIADNVITAYIAPDALSCPGRVRMDIVIVNGTEALATFDISVLVDAAPTSGVAPTNGYYKYKTLADINAALAARVQSVNNQAPDNKGNVQINAEQTGAVSRTAFDAAMTTVVRKVNGVTPDSDGNVNVSAESGGNVLSVNSQTGAVQIPTPASGVCGIRADIPAKVVESVSPGASPVEGGLVYVKFEAANTAENPTLTFMGYTAPIVDGDGNAVAPGALTAGTHGFQRRGETWVLLDALYVDTSLTISGKAADAKATGDALRSLSEEIENLGGGADVSVEPSEDDIPKVFFGGALQQTKDAAVVPFRYISKAQDIRGYAEIKAQGNSSMSYPKKNQTVKLFMDADCTEKLKVDFKGWGKQNKHVYKANWIDLSHARNVVSARLWADIVKSRANYEELPELLRTSPNQGAVDGFPIKVYAAGVYQGRYTLNIPKDKWMTNMDDSLETNCILCGENYASGCFRAAASINGSDWTDEIHDTVPDSIKTRWNEVISFVMNSTDDEFKTNLGNYFDIPSLIDYHLFGLQSCGLDAYGKNQLYLTYDGQKWIASMYDMDSTWGLYWNGSKFVATSYGRDEYEDMISGREGNLLYMRLEELFYERLQSRWIELKAGPLSIDNIINRFERFTDIAPSELVKEDYASTTGGGAFTGIPSKSTNNIQQIRAYALARQAWCDEYIAGLTPAEEVPCTGISLSAETLTFTEAGSQTLTATVEPDGCTDAVTWESSDTGVATVSEGVVTSVGNGGATITAICGGFSATCAVSVSGIISGETSLVYSLPEATTFSGANYIDTGIQLFDTLKDFTILLDYEEGSTNVNLATIFHCVKETSPWPGLCLQRNSGSESSYLVGGKTTGGSNFTSFTSTATRVSIACTGGSITGIKYVKNGDIVTASISANSGTVFEKNLLLGCYQDDSGKKGRYWKGTINKFDVYFSVLSDEEIDAWLTA